MKIPIVIICYNNYKYVNNTIKQILAIRPDYKENIIIMDNLSSNEKTKEYLRNADVRVIYNNENRGPWIDENCNSNVYNIMPEKFITTDPDLEFNKNLPYNFIEILSELSDNYKVNKIGFAIDISDVDKMTYYKEQYLQNYNNDSFLEKIYWKNKISEKNTYELYYAPIDTTFALVNKTHRDYSIRIAGIFTCRHLPWYDYKEVGILTQEDITDMYTNSPHSSNSNMILDYMNKK